MAVTERDLARIKTRRAAREEEQRVTFAADVQPHLQATNEDNHEDAQMEDFTEDVPVLEVPEIEEPAVEIHEEHDNSNFGKTETPHANATTIEDLSNQNDSAQEMQDLGLSNDDIFGDSEMGGDFGPEADDSANFDSVFGEDTSGNTGDLNFDMDFSMPLESQTTTSAIAAPVDTSITAQSLDPSTNENLNSLMSGFGDANGSGGVASTDFGVLEGDTTTSDQATATTQPQNDTLTETPFDFGDTNIEGLTDTQGNGQDNFDFDSWFN
jgi:hypothetical protein